VEEQGSLGLLLVFRVLGRWLSIVIWSVRWLPDWVIVVGIVGANRRRLRVEWTLALRGEMALLPAVATSLFVPASVALFLRDILVWVCRRITPIFSTTSVSLGATPLGIATTAQDVISSVSVIAAARGTIGIARCRLVLEGAPNLLGVSNQLSEVLAFPISTRDGFL